MFGVPDFEPNFFKNVDILLKVHGTTLLNMVNDKIEEYWIMWDTIKNECNPDGPVIFRIANKNYEFVSYQLDDFSFTIDTIDLSMKLNWYGMGDELPLIWKKNALDEVNSYIGVHIREVNILAYNSESTTMKYKAHSDGIEQISETSNMLYGVEFVFSKKGLLNRTNQLTIFNGLDNTGLTTKYIEQDDQVKRIKISGANTSFIK